jgi:hypothetical protein
MVGVWCAQDKARELDQSAGALIAKLVCSCMVASIAATYIYLTSDSQCPVCV